MTETPNPMAGSCPGLMTKVTDFLDEFKLKTDYDTAAIVGGDNKCLTANIEIDCATREGGGISEIDQVDVIEIAPSGSPLMLNTELWFSKTPLPTLTIDADFAITAGDEGELFGPIKIATADYVQSPISTTALATLKNLGLKFKTAGDTGSANSSKKIYMAHVATELTPYLQGTIMIILIKFKKH